MHLAEKMVVDIQGTCGSRSLQETVWLTQHELADLPVLSRRADFDVLFDNKSCSLREAKHPVIFLVKVGLAEDSGL